MEFDVPMSPLGAYRLSLKYEKIEKDFGWYGGGGDGTRAYHQYEGFDEKLYDDHPHVKAHKQAQDDHKRLNQFLYSLPWVAPYMRPWMLDIKFGNEMPHTDKKDPNFFLNMDQFEKDMYEMEYDPKAFEQRKLGPLISNISKDMRMLGALMSDRGFGSGGGHIGGLCTDAQKDAIITMMWTKYRKAIDANLVMPKIAWFAPKFFAVDFEKMIEHEKENENDKR